MKIQFFLVPFLLLCNSLKAAVDTVSFYVGLEKAAAHVFEIKMTVPMETPNAILDLGIPAWTPGYYQVLDFGKQVSDFRATDDKGRALQWQKTTQNSWRVAVDSAATVHVYYKIKADKSFVANPYMDTSRAFIRPTGVFMYLIGKLENPVIVSIAENKFWPHIATGLPRLSENSLLADNFDVLYDSPMLLGTLKELPSFRVGGKEHRFLGYGMKDFDGAALMRDLKSIVQIVTAIFDDIPYEDYTFIGLGEGNGGIEQLNSTAIAFTGEGMDERSSRLRTLSFIAHEYFHHYNVKRIRPLELGPFDYSGVNRTDGLWLSEGLTVYYEGILLSRSGLITSEEFWYKWEQIIANYEMNPGRKKQSLAESSLCTWEDGPFGRRGETISYYEKGPIIGMLLDMTIRSATSNMKSLDDVMCALYKVYYKEKQRGVTSKEVQLLCEEIAGVKLDEIFSYLYNTNDIDYPKYFSKIGVCFERSVGSDGSIKVNLRPIEDNTVVQQKIWKSLSGRTM
ncbi:M61 family metallopeptidase [Sphingobacterium tabacisoli]|uniref:M61 family metallopeptidase n=1 Tax=Sphingobacterium tabacisoli TaxID=2044855 RepID=A0ABW5L5Z7_9SPHI|nr:M61 family metallopeptidase [Sphingobacterium tabacisoli]